MFKKTKIERVSESLKANPILSWIFSHSGVTLVILAVFLLLFNVLSVNKGAMLLLVGIIVAVIEEKLRHG